MKRINVLGSTYTIEMKSKAEDPFLHERDGYCDKTSRRIVVRTEDKNDELDNYKVYINSMLRHEIIHAFLFESGLHENFTHPDWGHEETMIDWIAIQFPKIKKVFEYIGCL